MKYLLLAIIILIVILVVYYFFRRRWAIRKVKSICDEEKLSYINCALDPFGFVFDYACDIVVSKEDAWQKNLGYLDLYDLKAPFFNIVMDSEPIYFDYDGKHYRIEIWKGQYGITTGAEIGIYVQEDCLKFSKNYYRAANDTEKLNMSFTLSKKCTLFSRCDKSWWLTGFDIGVFSNPKDLKMDICICFPNCEMRDAFVNSLVHSGHSFCNLFVCENTVCFEYCTPKYYRPNVKHRVVKFIAQVFNYINCHIYMYCTRFFDRALDKLTYLRFMLPRLYRLIIKMSVPRRKVKKPKKHFVKFKK